MHRENLPRADFREFPVQYEIRSSCSLIRRDVAISQPRTVVRYFRILLFLLRYKSAFARNWPTELKRTSISLKMQLIPSCCFSGHRTIRIVIVFDSHESQ